MAPDEHCIRERGRRIGTQHLERFHAVNAGQLDVHEHQIGDALQGQPDTVLGRAGLHSFVSLGLEDVSHQFHVLLVVFNDQDQAHGWFGMVNVNVEPLPGVLSTRISPPCSSIIRLVRAGRKPVLKGIVADEDSAAEYSARFVREAKAVVRLNHLSIGQVYDFGEEGDIAYIAGRSPLKNVGTLLLNTTKSSRDLTGQ